MKTLRWFFVVAVLVLALGTGAATLFAAEGSPVGAPFIDNALHTLGANSTTWYRFQYPGDHSQVTIKLVDAKDKGLAFQVYTPIQMEDWWKNDGIGAGSPKDNDLIWSGNAHEGGQWYIQVVNRAGAPVSYQLIVTGSALPLTTLLPAITTLSPTTPSLDNIDPNHAFLADATPRVIPAKTALWYRFFYAGDHSQVNVRMPQGAENRLRFHVHTPTQMTKWWDILPVGQNSIQDNDLVWNGNSHEGGWWYIEVLNDNPNAVGFMLNVAGTGVFFAAPTLVADTAVLPKLGTSLENADPNKAFDVNSTWQVIPAKTTLWYRFAYTGSHDQAILKVLDGSKNLLHVHVHTPQQMKTWWDVNPVGQATPHGDDLVWNGNAQDGGWWYVEVMNDHTAAVSYQLLLQIANRNLE